MSALKSHGTVWLDPPKDDWMEDGRRIRHKDPECPERRTPLTRREANMRLINATDRCQHCFAEIIQKELEHEAFLEAERAKEGPRRGRPRGFKMEPESKAKISRTRRERGRTDVPVPPPNDESVDLIARQMVMERATVTDGNGALGPRCEGCHEPWRKVARNRNGKPKMVKGEYVLRINESAKLQIVLLETGADPNDLNKLALLCSSCRKTAAMMGIRQSDDIASRLAGL